MSFFQENLKKFQPYEVESSELIMKYKNVTILKFCDDNRYDFKTSDKIKYEVKTEPMSLKTNNYFVEFFAYGKPSGIKTTKANFYIFCDTVNYFMISVDVLKLIVKKHGVLIDTKDKLTRGYLVKCTIINDVSIKLN